MGIPLGLLLVCFARRGMVPFGEITILQWDQLLQYKDYYGFLWDVLHGKANIAYSFSKSLGGGMFGSWAYYLSSLGNVFLLFFEKNAIAQYLSFSYALKTAACGLTAGIYVQRRFSLSPIWIVLLSTSYALMEYNVDYCRNLMWLDGGVMLPLMCLGVWYCINQRHQWLLPLTTGLSIICNWYTGYMNCIMAGIYLCYELLFVSQDAVLKYAGIRKKRGNAFSRTAMLLLLGAGASAVVLLPAALSMLGSDKAGLSFSHSVNMSLGQMLAGFAIEAPYNAPNAPLIYTGGICLLLTVYSLWSDRIPVRNKLGYVFLLFIGICSFLFRGVELIWTVLREGNSYNYRFSYIFSFILVAISGSALAFDRNKNGSRPWIPMAGALFTLLIGYLLLLKAGTMQSLKWNHFCMAAIAVYAAAMILCPGTKIKYAIILPLLCIELSKNALVSFNVFSNRAESVQKYNEGTEGIISELMNEDDHFYRIEKNFSYLTTIGRNVADCESLAFGYHGIEAYLSTYDWRVNQFLNNIGYSNLPGDDRYPCEMYWNDSMPVAESILSVKYVLSDKPLYGYETVDFGDDIKPPEGYAIYRNQRWLPMAFGIQSEFADIVFGRDPFENQNRLISAMTGIKEPVLRMMHTEPEKTEDGKEERYTLISKEGGPVYLFIDGEDIHPDYYASNCSLYVNGTLVQDCCSRFVTNGMYLGHFEKGEKVEICIEHHSEAVGVHCVYAYEIDETIFDQVYQCLSGRTLEQMNVEDGKILAESHFDQATTVFFSVPYESGWKCFVDGKSIQPRIFGNTFITLDIPAGKHSISLQYQVEGFTGGAVLSGISGLVIAFLALSDLPKKETKK